VSKGEDVEQDADDPLKKNIYRNRFPVNDNSGQTVDIESEYHFEKTFYLFASQKIRLKMNVIVEKKPVC
jgi:hypothetical protein